MMLTSKDNATSVSEICPNVSQLFIKLEQEVVRNNIKHLSALHSLLKFYRLHCLAVLIRYFIQANCGGILLRENIGDSP